jgi:hypothetical protein
MILLENRHEDPARAYLFDAIDDALDHAARLVADWMLDESCCPVTRKRLEQLFDNGDSHNAAKVWNQHCPEAEIFIYIVRIEAEVKP